MFELTRQKTVETFEDLKKQFGKGSGSTEEDQTDAQKREAYQKAESELGELEQHKALVQHMIDNINAELEERQEKVHQNVIKAKQSQERLSEIALKPNPLTDEQYVELMIQSEEQEKKPGFIERVATLKRLKEQAKITQKAQGVFSTASNPATTEQFTSTELPPPTKDKRWWHIFH